LTSGGEFVGGEHDTTKETTTFTPKQETTCEVGRVRHPMTDNANPDDVVSLVSPARRSLEQMMRMASATKTRPLILRTPSVMHGM